MTIFGEDEDLDNGTFNLFDDSTEPSNAQITQDAIGKQLDEAAGEAEASDTNTKGGEAGAEDKAGGEREAAKPDSNSGAKDGAGKQPSDDKAKEETGKSDNTGDLKLQDGTVIKAGNERKFYEQWQLAQHQVNNHKNTVNQLREGKDRAVSELRTLQDTIRTTHGVDAATVTNGVKMFQDMRRDPIGTVQKLLAEMAAAGYTIDGIGQGTEVAAITRLIDQRLAPITQERTQQQDAEAIEREAQKEAATFFRTFPDAKIHEALIARVASDHPDMELSDVYYDLRNSFIQKGFDWSKPLAPQIQASEQQQQQPKTPMPNGRNGADSAVASAKEKTVVAHESTDMNDIIKQSMREAGLNI